MRVLKATLSVSLILAAAVPAFAFPEYLDKYKKDPMYKAGVDGCNVCHNSPSGGDDRNAFGQAFEKASGTITPMIRAQFPDKFNYPTSRVADGVVIHFSDPGGKQLVLEAGGKKVLVDAEKRTVDGQGASAPAAAAGPIAANMGTGNTEAPAPVGSAINSSANPENLMDVGAREGAFFGMSVINLPNGKSLNAGGTEFFIGHRFTQPFFQRSVSEFFGLDSSAFITFGFRAGLTDWLSVQAARSNRYKTVELASSAQLMEQRDGMPVTLQVRGGLEGQDNFREKYSPFVQVVAARTFADRVSVLAAPTFAFKTRDALSFRFPPEFLFGDADANYTASVGLGMGVRVLPSVSVVGEWIPRVGGFKGELFDRPALSFGLKKSTYRHTFEILLSTAEPMTTAQYVTRGSDTYKIGFNIYRKIR